MVILFDICYGIYLNLVFYFYLLGVFANLLNFISLALGETKLDLLILFLGRPYKSLSKDGSDFTYYDFLTAGTGLGPYSRIYIYPSSCLDFVKLLA